MQPNHSIYELFHLFFRSWDLLVSLLDLARAAGILAVLALVPILLYRRRSAPGPRP